MSNKMNNTQKMKNSGIEWIGEIPVEWERTKLKRLLATPITDGPHETPTLLDNGVPFLSAEAVKNHKLNFDLKRGFISYDEHNRFCKKCKPQLNDIFMVKSGATTGNIAIVDTEEEFSIWSPLALIRANKDCIFYKFLFYYLQSDNFRKQVELFWSYGTQQNIGMEVLGNLYVSYSLNLNTQTRIAEYLDKKCGEIDKSIALQRRAIEKLKEYKQSLISECVTGKLSINSEPNTQKMKNSGIEWIGDIPEYWKVVRIKNVAMLKGRIGWQGLKSTEYQETGAYLITGTDFDNGVINWDTCVHITQERFNEAPEIHIKENDLLITKDGTVGKVALALNCPEQVSLNSGVMLIRNNKELKYKSKFLYYILLSNVFWSWFSSNLNGNSTIIHLYQEQFYNFSFPFPPQIEQQQIADYLDYKCAEIDAVINGKEQVIEKLDEYKKSLIYECVTGKMRV